MHTSRPGHAIVAMVLLLGADAGLSGCGGRGDNTPAEQRATTVSPTPSITPTPSVAETGPEKGLDLNAFTKPTTVDNKWFSLKPGTQFVYEGETMEEGERIPHRVIFTVTDLTKTIAGIPNIVVWDRDFSADMLVESELAFFAQANNGDVWHFGQYPEEYEEGELVGTPAWIHGLQGAQAGITMKANPRPGAPSYSQGWGPEVAWSDRARVHQTGQRTCVPAGCYDGVLVTDEFSLDEPNAHQLKYYAPGVGNVRVGWSGDDPTKETLELVRVVQLTPAQMTKVRAEAMALEKRAYQNSKNVYAHTTPMEPLK